MKKPRAVERLAAEFGKIPGIGPRHAERTVYFMLASGADFIDNFAAAVSAVKDLVTCSECRAIAESSPCPVCADPSRDSSKLLVVASVADAEAVERTGRYDGRYFVLGGLLSPLDGVNAGDLPVNALARFVRAKKFDEVIIGTDPNAKGDATAILIAEALAGECPSVTRLAYGLPFGGDLEYADGITLSGAIEGRRRMFGGEKSREREVAASETEK